MIFRTLIGSTSLENTGFCRKITDFENFKENAPQGFPQGAVLHTEFFKGLCTMSTKALRISFHDSSPPSIFAPQLGQKSGSQSHQTSASKSLNLSPPHTGQIGLPGSHRPCTTGATSAAGAFQIGQLSLSQYSLLHWQCFSQYSSRSMYSAIVRSPHHIRHAVLRVIPTKT